MSDPISTDPATTPPPAPRTGTGGGSSRLLAAVAVGLAAVALAGTAVLWQRLARTQEELARRTTDAQAELAAARVLADQAQAAVADLQARLGVAEVKLSEVSLQRTQLEELMLSVSRSRDDALVQDLEAALRLAIQQSQLTGSVQPDRPGSRPRRPWSMIARRSRRTARHRRRPPIRPASRPCRRLRPAPRLRSLKVHCILAMYDCRGFGFVA